MEPEAVTESEATSKDEDKSKDENDLDSEELAPVASTVVAAAFLFRRLFAGGRLVTSDFRVSIMAKRH